MTRNLLIFAVILVILVTTAFFTFSILQKGQSSNKTADINGYKIILEVASTPDQQAKGLSGRNSLADDRGMLFVFSSPDIYEFWMKNMKFPIDIIFLSGDKVVTIYRNVQPQLGLDNNKADNFTLYSPKQAVDKVIEVNAGTAEKYSLKEGDTIKIN